MRKIVIVFILCVIGVIILVEQLRVVAEDNEPKITQHNISTIQKIFSDAKTINLSMDADVIMKVSHGEDETSHCKWDVWFRAPNCFKINTVLDMDPVGKRKEHKILITQGDLIIWKEKYKSNVGEEKVAEKCYVLKYITDGIKKIDINLALKLKEEDGFHLLLCLPQLFLNWFPACYDIEQEIGKTKDGKDIYIFKGTPKKELPCEFQDKNIFKEMCKSKIVLYVSKETNIPLKIEFLESEEEPGISQTFFFRNIELNKPIPDKFFSYTPSEGCRISEEKITTQELPQNNVSSITANETAAISMLKILTSAQSVWRQQDCDGNGIKDYWTYDISCFNRMYRADGVTKVNFIDAAFARADANRAVDGVFGKSPAFENWDAGPKQLTPAPKSGYWYSRLTTTFINSGVLYQINTVGTNSVPACHNSLFAFVAYPAEYGKTGIRTFIVNEGGTVYATDCGSDKAKVVLQWPATTQGGSPTQTTGPGDRKWEPAE